jgi:hypothetical protein
MVEPGTNYRPKILSGFSLDTDHRGPAVGELQMNQ